PIDALCTDRFQRFRGLRKVPPDSRSKAIQITASAPTSPSIRVSTSRGRNRPATGANAERSASANERTRGAGWPCVVASPGTETPISSLLRPPLYAWVKKRPAPRERGRGAFRHVGRERVNCRRRLYRPPRLGTDRAW